MFHLYLQFGLSSFFFVFSTEIISNFDSSNKHDIINKLFCPIFFLFHIFSSFILFFLAPLEWATYFHHHHFMYTSHTQAWWSEHDSYSLQKKKKSVEIIIFGKCYISLNNIIKKKTDESTNKCKGFNSQTVDIWYSCYKMNCFVYGYVSVCVCVCLYGIRICLLCFLESTLIEVCEPWF